ncbi:MAG: methyltransferase domain-containing protein [Eubacteriales bacterium]
MSETHRNYFNEQAPVWDEMMAHKPLERLNLIFKPLGIKKGSVILDVGTGTGVMLPLLQAIIGSSGKIVAFDIAEEMLKQAREKNGNERIEYVQGDISATLFDQHTFDEVICHACFPHFSDKQVAVKEIARILKPGGRVIITHLSSRNELNSMHLSLGGVVGGDVLPDEESMKIMFNKAGFKDMKVIDQEDRYVITARSKVG